MEVLTKKKVHIKTNGYVLLLFNQILHERLSDSRQSILRGGGQTAPKVPLECGLQLVQNAEGHTGRELGVGHKGIDATS
jgi:hypothetical protein